MWLLTFPEESLLQLYVSQKSHVMKQLASKFVSFVFQVSFFVIYDNHIIVLTVKLYRCMVVDCE